MDVRIEISKEWFDQNKVLFSKAYDELEYVEDKDKGGYYFISLDIENNELLLSNEDEIRISGGDNNIYIGVSAKPTIDELLNLSQIISKYYNKAKAAIEALR